MSFHNYFSRLRF